MRIKTSIRRETIALYAAANMLFAMVAAIVALWAGASLVAIPWLIATTIYAIIAISIAITQSSVSTREPVAIPRRAVRR